MEAWAPSMVAQEWVHSGVEGVVDSVAPLAGMATMVVTVTEEDTVTSILIGGTAVTKDMEEVTTTTIQCPEVDSGTRWEDAGNCHVPLLIYTLSLEVLCGLTCARFHTACLD